MKAKIAAFRRKAVPFVKKYWRELAVVAMFLVVQYQISDVNDLLKRVGKVAAIAADYADDAADNAEDAYYAASDAQSSAQEAADNSSYCW